jgi:hypothetical protein
METPFDRKELDEVHQRGLESLDRDPRAISARYDANSNLITVELNTGYFVSFSPQRSQPLAKAKPEDLTEIEITFPGFGLYFPRLDEDISVKAIALGRFGSDRWEAAWHDAHPRNQRPYPVNSRSEAA